MSARLHTGKLKVNLATKRKKTVTKSVNAESVRTSLLDAGLRLCQAKFASLCFLKSREQFRTVSIEKYNSSTNRLFPLENITLEVRLQPYGDGIEISNPLVSRSFTISTSMIGQIIVLPGRGKTRQS